jgi:DNA-binding NtrC family response regulator
VLSPVLNTPGLQEVTALARRVAIIPAAVLIVAEKGGPAEALAQLIHLGSGTDSNREWLRLDTSSGPDFLDTQPCVGPSNAVGTPLSQLSADGGTLFITSIEHLSPSSQVRLSALLLSNPSGTSRAVHRVIAATSVDLSEEVKQRRFRRDLFERLTAITVTVPPLRKRPADIIILATMFARAEATTLGTSFGGFSGEAEDKLSLHSYPGNEEELYRTVKRAIAATGASAVTATSIEFDSPAETVANIFVDDQARSSRERNGRVPTLSEIERAYVVWALKYTSLNRTAAARLLGISYPTIAKKISDYGIDVASLGPPSDRTTT